MDYRQKEKNEKTNQDRLKVFIKDDDSVFRNKRSQLQGILRDGITRHHSLGRDEGGEMNSQEYQYSIAFYSILQHLFNNLYYSGTSAADF